MTFAVELIGVAYYLLLNRFGKEIFFGKGEMLLTDIFCRKAGARMAFTNAGYSFAKSYFLTTAQSPLVAHHFCSKTAVKEVGMGAVTMDAGSVSGADSDIVEHGGIFKENGVGAKFGVASGDGKGATRYLTAVKEEKTTQIVVGGVVFVNYLLKKHSFFRILLQSYAIFQNFALNLLAILRMFFKKTLILMLIIGIAGGTGSGKTTVVRKIIEALPADAVAVIPQDSYYKHQWDVPEELRKKTNFDHPNAFDWELFEQQIEALRNGQAIEQPTYSYLTCTRQKETIHVEPREVIIVEGIMALYDKKLRDLMDLKIYVDADTDERLLRVIERDIAERGHPLEMLIDKYRNVLKPMHDEFIEPTKLYADIIIPNGGDNARAVAMMRQFITSAYIQQELDAAFAKK